MSADERDELNRVLHFGATPCRSACTHVITGRWTALGMANVLARVDDAPVPSPSTDTAGDANRWTAEVVERWSGRRYHTVVRLSDGNHAAESIGLTATAAESLAAQINRPAPSPDEHSLAHLVTLHAIAAAPDDPELQEQWSGRLQGMAMSGLVWRFPGKPWRPTAYGRRIVAIFASDAGEPPTGSGCA